MELELKDGDYLADGIGGLRQVSGNQALLQRVLFKLTARREAFPFQPELGSRLWRLNRMPPVQRQSAARQYVAEALADEAELTVEKVELQDGNRLQIVLNRQGEKLPLTLRIE